MHFKCLQTTGSNDEVCLVYTPVPSEIGEKIGPGKSPECTRRSIKKSSKKVAYLDPKTKVDVAFPRQHRFS